MENDPVTLVIALDNDNVASGQLYFDDGITHDWEIKKEFILGNLNASKSSVDYTLVFRQFYILSTV